jgi:hypothetical protein
VTVPTAMVSTAMDRGGWVRLAGGDTPWDLAVPGAWNHKPTAPRVAPGFDVLSGRTSAGLAS